MDEKRADDPVGPDADVPEDVRPDEAETTADPEAQVDPEPPAAPEAEPEADDEVAEDTEPAAEDATEVIPAVPAEDAPADPEPGDTAAESGAEVAAGPEVGGDVGPAPDPEPGDATEVIAAVPPADESGAEVAAGPEVGGDVGRTPDPEPGDATEVIAAVPPADESGAEVATDPGPEDATEVIAVVPPADEPRDAVTEVLPAAPAVVRTPAAAAYARLQEGATVPAQAAAPSPFDDFRPAPKRRWKRNLAVVASVVLVLGAAYVGLLWAWADRVPPGTSVAGVEIGGLDADTAVRTLQDSLRTTATEPFSVTAGERATTIDPAAAGLALDARATVDGLTGFDLHPAVLWRQIFGAGPADPVSTVDAAALTAAVETAAHALAVDPVDGTVTFVDGVAHGGAPVDGLAVDEAAAATTLRESWLTAARPIALPTVVVPPVITQAVVDATVVDLARPISSGPVSVTVAGQVAPLPASLLTSVTTFVREDDRLVARMDGERLREALLARTTGLLTDPQDARFEFVDGVPMIVAGDPGTDVDPDDLATVVAQAAVAANRTAQLALTEIDPEQTVAALQELGVVEKVSEFSTSFPNDPDRTHNLAVAADLITGTLVLPGDTFTLTDVVGPVSPETGYRTAPVVVNGRLVQGLGGGLSQVATTTYNAAFFAGLEDVEHTPHSYWFSRYPEGREATLYEGLLDLRFRNNTPYGVLMQAWLEGGRLYVAAWSTEYWEVEEWTSGRSGIVQPTTVYDQSSGCVAQAVGNPGFSVTVGRRLLLDGVEQETQEWSWTYRPQNGVVCGPEPTAEPPAEQ